MKLGMGLRLHNRFEVELIDIKTGGVRQKAKAENLVTDSYYNTLVTDLSNNQYWNSVKNLVIGTGTGTPSVSDTALFHQIFSGAFTQPSAMYRISDTEFYWESTVTLAENQANGNLTEIGLYAPSENYAKPYLFSHAMFTDSEGNPMVIEKTDTDRMSVTITVYISLRYDPAVIPLPFCNRWLSVYCPKRDNSLSLAYSDICDPSPIGVPEILKWLMLDPRIVTYLFRTDLHQSYRSVIPKFATARGCVPRYDWGFRGTVSTPITATPVTRRFSADRILSSAYNIDVTYQMFGFLTPIGYIPLPNHEKFPPLSLELSKVAAANQQDFNFGIAELMPDVTVFVNDVEQPANSYVWGGKDFTLKQAWASAHGDKLLDHNQVPFVSNSNWGYTPLAGVSLSCMYTSSALTWMSYDFVEPKAVNTLKSEGQCTLYKSDDGETWVEVAKTTSNTLQTVTFEEVSARYWKVSGTLCLSGNTMNQAMTSFVGNFDKVTPQLHFNTPLAEGDVVKIQCKSEFPIKNSNWLIDQFVVDWQIGKDESE